jgi:hypothetical protein
MKIVFDYHPEGLLITPLCSIAAGECENPNCQAQHLMFSLGWLVWSMAIVFEIGGCER